MRLSLGLLGSVLALSVRVATAAGAQAPSPAAAATPAGEGASSAAASASGPANAPGGPLPKAASEPWIVVQAGRLSVYSTADERATREVAMTMERLRQAMGALTKLRVEAPLPTRVFVFRNVRQAEPYVEALHPDSKGLVGLFYPGHDANYIVLTDPAHPEVVNHELVHYFLHNSLTNVPLWFDEGLAEFYSTFRVENGKDDASIEVGRLPEFRIQYLRDESLLPLAKLFAVTAKSSEYNEKDRRSVFYAESWALVHHLLLGTEARRVQLYKFLDAMRDGASQEAAFRGAFQQDYKELEQDLRIYVRKSRFPVARASVPPIAAASLTSRALAADEAMARLAELLAQRPSARSEAEKHARAATRMAPGSALANGVLGWLASLGGNDDEAERAFERATATGGPEAEPFVWYGMHLLHRSAKEGTRADDTARNRRARELFTAALEREPDSPVALTGLGGSYLDEDDLAPGIKALERATALAPTQDEGPVYLMMLLLRSGDRARADAIRDRLSLGAEPRELERIDRAYTYSALERSRRLVQAGQMDEARVLLDELLAHTSDTVLRERIEKMRSYVDTAKKPAGR